MAEATLLCLGITSTSDYLISAEAEIQNNLPFFQQCYYYFAIYPFLLTLLDIYDTLSAQVPFDTLSFLRVIRTENN